MSDHTEWLVDGVLASNSTLAHPDLAMPLRINLRAPASTWGDAYDANLQPVNTPQQNSSYEVIVDWVEVRTLP